MKLTMTLPAILLVAACSAAGQPERDREARADRDIAPPDRGREVQVNREIAPPDRDGEAAIKRDIATHLIDFAEWCLSQQLVEEAWTYAVEAREIDPGYPPLPVLMRKIVATAREDAIVPPENIDRRKRELGDAVGRQYLSLFRWGTKRSEQPTYDRYLQRAFQHDPARATAFLDALWYQSLDSRNWSQLQRLYAVMETTALDQDVRLERLRQVYEANPPAGRRSIYDRALRETFERRPDAVGSIFDAEWRAARAAGDYARARYLLSGGSEARRIDGITRLLGELDQLEMDQLRAQVVPGGQFVMKFPELGPTMNGPDHFMEMGVALPAEYTAAGKWALVLSLGGGNGNAKPKKNLVAGLPTISIGLPYPADPQSPSSIAPNPSLLWPMYRVMLAKLERVVPNIDPDRRVVFGFSNGAHAITGLIAESDHEFQRMFKYMIAVEGGTFMRKWTEAEWQSLANHHLLFAGGDRAGKGQAQTLTRLAQKRGIDAELYVFPGGHAMSPQLVSKAREWIALKLYGRRAAARGLRKEPAAVPPRSPASNA